MQDQSTGITLKSHGNWFSSNGTRFQLLIISTSSRLSAHSDLALHTGIFSRWQKERVWQFYWCWITHCTKRNGTSEASRATYTLEKAFMERNLWISLASIQLTSCSSYWCHWKPSALGSLWRGIDIKDGFQASFWLVYLKLHPSTYSWGCISSLTLHPSQNGCWFTAQPHPTKIDSAVDHLCSKLFSFHAGSCHLQVYTQDSLLLWHNPGTAHQVFFLFQNSRAV